MAFNQNKPAGVGGEKKAGSKPAHQASDPESSCIPCKSVILLDMPNPPDQPPRDPYGDSQTGEVLPSVARDRVRVEVSGEAAAAASASSAQAEGYLGLRRGVFVTIWHTEGHLRGCKGTVQPTRCDLIEETRASALSAALEDGRCPPVTESELEKLRFEVSVLGELEPVQSREALDPCEFGVYLRAADGRKGLLLPGIEGLDTVEGQLAALYRKAGLREDESVGIELLRFRIDKFHEGAQPRREA